MVHAATEVHWRGSAFHSGDVVILESRFFLVETCVDCGFVGLLCKELVTVERTSPACSKVRSLSASDFSLLRLDGCGPVRVAQAWATNLDGTLIVLHPRL